MTENKDALGSYFEEAKGLLESPEGLNELCHNMEGYLRNKSRVIFLIIPLYFIIFNQPMTGLEMSLSMYLINHVL
ncbi:hypothetical protein [Streptococcus pseudoporcinus]|uniref:Uncharacterized protein n=1 Tax=Streptococcus pseudoporcinus LQ 940-04 TaxID=875093 RepID=G5KAT4_9STRE|nr:hypothetical protein [Streptococcus pseudoporcinus]EFR44692.1 hypothetical protein HMPREF9320_0685 [Streptococcus pseudoporcinus SPIN 20026]EHI64999.1 hypothetical protein STRPS_2046 [Streptococcus pseudoporcinus LQ 940-04]